MVLAVPTCTHYCFIVSSPASSITPSVSPAGTAPAPSGAACPARWRYPWTRPAGTWLWPGRLLPFVLSLSKGLEACRRSRSRSRPVRGDSLHFGRRPGRPRSVPQLDLGCSWSGPGAQEGGPKPTKKLLSLFPGWMREKRSGLRRQRSVTRFRIDMDS